MSVQTPPLDFFDAHSHNLRNKVFIGRKVHERDTKNQVRICTGTVQCKTNIANNSRAAAKSSKLCFRCSESVVSAKIRVISKCGNISYFVSNRGHEKYYYMDIWGLLYHPEDFNQMPRSKKASTRAKVQRQNHQTMFGSTKLTSTESDNLSEYDPSDDDNTLSENEDGGTLDSITAMQQLYAVFLPMHLKPPVKSNKDENGVSCLNILSPHNIMVTDCIKRLKGRRHQTQTKGWCTVGTLAPVNGGRIRNGRKQPKEQ